MVVESGERGRGRGEEGGDLEVEMSVKDVERLPKVDICLKFFG